MPCVPKLVYIFNAIPTKISAGFFADINKLNLKFIWKFKGLKIAKGILKKNKIGGYTFPDFKTSSKATVTKTVWC